MTETNLKLNKIHIAKYLPEITNTQNKNSAECLWFCNAFKYSVFLYFKFTLERIFCYSLFSIVVCKLMPIYHRLYKAVLDDFSRECQQLQFSSCTKIVFDSSWVSNRTAASWCGGERITPTRFNWYHQAAAAVISFQM